MSLTLDRSGPKAENLLNSLNKICSVAWELGLSVKTVKVPYETDCTLIETDFGNVKIMGKRQNENSQTA